MAIKTPPIQPRPSSQKLSRSWTTTGRRWSSKVSLTRRNSATLSQFWERVRNLDDYEHIVGKGLVPSRSDNTRVVPGKPGRRKTGHDEHANIAGDPVSILRDHRQMWCLHS